MLQVRRCEALDSADIGWLRGRYHFRIGPDGNANHHPIGSLIVWNDDEVKPGTGFPLHPHENLEIITYVREGAVTHKDTLGSEGVTGAGDVQVMSAGTGIRHSEYNLGNGPMRMFQIWLLPREPGGEPRWDARKFPKADRAGQFVPLASGFEHDGEALMIRADARVLGATLLAGQDLTYDLAPGRGGYLVSSNGTATVNGERLQAGDGVAILAEARIQVHADTDVELLMVDTGPPPQG